MHRSLIGFVVALTSSTVLGDDLIEPTTPISGVVGDFQFTQFGAGSSLSRSSPALGREPEENRIAWAFTHQTDSYERLSLELDAFTTYREEETLVDRFGNVTIIPAAYRDGFVEIDFGVAVSEPVNVRLTLDSDGLTGVNRFQADYFGRTLVYAADASTDTLLPETTLVPDGATSNPLDVTGFSDVFSLGAGDHPLGFELTASHLELGGDGGFIDGSVRLAIEFFTTPPTPGDYNLDNAVNAADYASWRDQIGRRGVALPEDGDASSVVDAGDYGVWAAAYGDTGPSGSGPSLTTAVPEPTGISAATAISLLAACRRRARRLI